MRVGPCYGDGTRAFDECVTAGVGVGVDKDQLPGSLLESREKGVGFGIGIAQDGHGMPCSRGWRSDCELEVKCAFRGQRARTVLIG